MAVFAHVVSLTACLAAACGATPAEPVESLEEREVLTRWLVLPQVDRLVRQPLPIDGIIHRLVAGTWQPPAAGDAEEDRTGAREQAFWTAAETTTSEPLRHDYLRGGWAYTKVIVDSPRRALLHASGHGIAYVNGEPSVGNAYGYQYVRIPIMLKRGVNHFLFRCLDGQLRAALEPVTDDLMINAADATLPDAVRGEVAELHAGVLAMNTTGQWIDVAATQDASHRSDRDAVALPHRRMPPLSLAKLPLLLPARPDTGRALTYTIAGASIQNTRLRIDVVEPEDFRKVTFVSAVDGSVQYYALRPRRRPYPDTPASLMLHTHGAGTEAAGHRSAYYAKTWCAIASATNRRPYGFDWEDWGRLDALEVLDHAIELVQPDPSRIYLGGHSMGGHGVWQLAGHFPDRFAAIGPSAAWQDFWTYTDFMPRYADAPAAQMLDRCSNVSRTALLAPNYAQHGVFIIHGDADDVVPTREAYAMRDRLGQTDHQDLVLHIEPGGKHVWDTAPEPGVDSFDLLALFDFFQRHARPLAPRRVDFTTITPSISSSCHWVRVEQQSEQMQPSRVQLQLDPGRRWLVGSLVNVRRFAVDPESLIEPGPLTVQLDGEGPWPVEWRDGPLHFERDDDSWRLAQALLPSHKGPHRGGLFKNAFANRPILVVGTAGTAEENTWALRKARFDNEIFWYRGNATFQIAVDTEFDPRAEPDRNVVLYGNARTNRAWQSLLGDSPIQVGHGEVEVGDRRFSGDDLACLMIRPRPGSDVASVGVVGGTGIIGMRAALVLPYFVSGTHYPDFTVFSADSWRSGVDAVLSTGLFGNDWSLKTGAVAWAE